MFDTDLSGEYEMGPSARGYPHACYLAGPQGALCEESTRAQLRQRGENFDWQHIDTASPEDRLAGDHDRTPTPLTRRPSRSGTVLAPRVGISGAAVST